MKKVLVIKGKSKYNVLSRATEEIAEGFKLRGYEVAWMDGQEKNPLQKILGEEYCFIFSCQAFYFDTVLGQSVPLLQDLKRPYIGWIFDDPLYHRDRIRNVKFDNAWLFTVDAQFPNVIQMMYPATKNIFFLPHGGFLQKELLVENGGALDKEYDILFPGNLGEKPSIEDCIPDCMPIEKFFIQETLKLLERCPQLSSRLALEQVLRSNGEEMSGELLMELDRVVGYVDLYLRYECKYRILNELIKEGFSVHIAGKGMENTLASAANVAYHGEVDIEDVVAMIGKSKIVINPVPTLTGGMHERIVTAMLGRAACFTPYNAYLEESLGQRLEYIWMNDLGGMAKRIRQILEEFPAYDASVLQDNYRYAMENHTWGKRGEQIVEFYEKQIL